MTSHELPPDVAARMAERVAALQAKRERNRADREAFSTRRAYGLEVRKRTKLARNETDTVMSLPTRQHTCAVCGAPIDDADRWTAELIVDDLTRFVAVHEEHTCYPTPDPGKP